MELQDFLDHVNRGQLALLSRLTGKAVDESVAVFPPFYSEVGKNLTFGFGTQAGALCRTASYVGDSIASEGPRVLG